MTASVEDWDRIKRNTSCLSKLIKIAKIEQEKYQEVTNYSVTQSDIIVSFAN